MNVNDGGTWKSAIPHVNDAGTWKAVKEVWVNDGGTWKQAFISVVVTPAPTSQSASGTASARTFAAVTVTVTGGTATSYNWGFSAAEHSWSVISGQGTATATPRLLASGGGDVASATFWCDVVVGGQTFRANVPLSYTNTSGA